VPSEEINPLKLESRPGLVESPPAPEPVNAKVDNVTEAIVEVPTEPGLRRRRRELKIRSERVYDSEGRAHMVVNMVSRFFL